MPFLPVAAREARGAARSMRMYVWRAVIVLIGLAMVPASLWWESGPKADGARVFMALSIMAFLYCLLAGAVRTADALAEERRENTLGLLFLTDLKAGDVLSGKLLASTATVFFGLLAILPILAIPVLLGGVTSRQFLETAVNLLNTLFLSISIGFLVSSRVREGWATVSFALVLILFLGLGLPSIASLGALDRDDPLWATLLLFSPTYAQALAFEGGAEGQMAFWSTVTVNHLIAWLCILYTAKYLPRVWQEVPRSARAEAWWRRMQRIRFGGTKTRTKFRRRLLDSNPLYWLSGREQVSSGGLMALLMGMVAVSMPWDWQGKLVGLLGMHLVLLTRMASAASHALAEDRKSGGLELLLGTSLSIADLLKGKWLGMRRQFFGPALIVSVWHFFTVAWMSWVENSNDFYLVIAFAWAVFFLSWVATGWCGMWFGLRARHSMAAMAYTLVWVAIGPWLLMVAGYGAVAALGLLEPTQTPYFSPFGSSRIFFDDRLSHVASAFLVWAIYLFALSAWASRRIKERFREAASDRFLSAAVDWARMRKAAAVFVAVVVAGLLAMVGYRFTINFRGERALRDALAAHPNFSLKKPEPPFYRPEENLARWDFLGVINDSGTYAPYYMGRAGPRSLREVLGGGYQGDSALEGWRQGRTFHIKGKANASVQETAAAYLKRFAVYDPEVERLLKAAKERPYIQFSEKASAAPSQFWQPPDYWAETVVPTLVQFLARRAGAKIQLGQNALEEVLLCARLAACTTNALNGPQLWQQSLVVAIQPVYDGLLAGTWTDADLAAIQKYFEAVDALQFYPHWIETVARARVAASEKRSVQTVQMTGTGFFTTQVMVDRHDEELAGRIKERQAAVIRLGLEELITEVDLPKRIVPPPQPLSMALRREPMLAEFIDQARDGVGNLARIQTAADEVALACALERFRRERGHYPPKFEEVVPEYIPLMRQLPKDVFDGARLRYRAETSGQGYVLYSIGWDRNDDGGKPESAGAGDWVWIIRR